MNRNTLDLADAGAVVEHLPDLVEPAAVYEHHPVHELHVVPAADFDHFPQIGRAAGAGFFANDMFA